MKKNNTLCSTHKGRAGKFRWARLFIGEGATARACVKRWTRRAERRAQRQNTGTEL